ncbi:HIRAN domain-containing protein [Pannus brasiliensis CCIBt3594]|uniref:HIRAN domain-containing protein n=1 Tax=Pannus brasiliensis CCIBt3594 TaxID=1427578 RepID=A0AAW9QJD6_9CHRO
MSFDGDRYEFVYIAGVEEAIDKAGFTPLTSFPDLHKFYRSTDLFFLFANRLMRPSRPDYQQYIEYLNLSGKSYNSLDILSRSGGKKATDNLEIFGISELDDNNFYHLYFFTHGLRYHPESLEKAQNLQENEPVFLVSEPDNSHDPQAIYVTTEDKYNIGYCPRYLTDDIHQFLESEPESIRVTVEKVNPPPAPIQFRVLCHLIARNFDNYQPFSSEKYRSIAERELTVP